MIENIFDEIDVQDIITSDIALETEEIPELPTLDKYEYLFTVWLTENFSMDPLSWTCEKLHFLIRNGLIEKCSDAIFWYEQNDETVFLSAKDVTKRYTTKERIRCNDTRLKKFKMTIGMNCKMSLPLLTNILYSLIGGDKRVDSPMIYHARRLVIDVSRKGSAVFPVSFEYSYSILDHFSKKNGVGADYAAAFKRILFIYQELRKPVIIREREYNSFKNMFRIAKYQNVNRHFTEIFKENNIDTGYKRLSRGLEKAVIGKKITLRKLLELLKLKDRSNLNIIQMFPWAPYSAMRRQLNGSLFIKEPGEFSYKCNFIDSLEVLDVRMNQYDRSDFVIILYLGPTVTYRILKNGLMEACLQEIFIEITDSYQCGADVIKTMKALFPEIDKESLKTILCG